MQPRSSVQKPVIYEFSIRFISHLAMLRLSAEYLHAHGALLQELTERVLLQTYITDSARCLPRLLTRVYEDQHLVLTSVLQHL